MSRPLFTVGILDAGEGSCVCGRPAKVLISWASLNVEMKFCGNCYEGCHLQAMKNNHVEIDAIHVAEVFEKLSAALEAQAPNFVM